MIPELSEHFRCCELEIKQAIIEQKPETYKELLYLTVKVMYPEDDYKTMNLDANRIAEIDNGDYQGTLIFVVARKGYQSSAEEHFYTKVNYGSCSGCDTLESILCGSETDEQKTNDLYKLALDMIANMHPMYSRV